MSLFLELCRFYSADVRLTEKVVVLMSLLTSRRDFLATLTATAVAAHLKDHVGAAAKTLRGAFMILNTPFTHDGAVDWEDLAREAAFVDRAGCQGIVWPQGSSAVATLTKDERLRGMEVLAGAVQGKQVALVLVRSEERRVGKECRSRWSPYH